MFELTLIVAFIAAPILYYERRLGRPSHIPSLRRKTLCTACYIVLPGSSCILLNLAIAFIDRQNLVHRTAEYTIILIFSGTLLPVLLRLTAPLRALSPPLRAASSIGSIVVSAGILTIMDLLLPSAQLHQLFEPALVVLPMVAAWMVLVLAFLVDVYIALVEHQQRKRPRVLARAGSTHLLVSRHGNREEPRST